MSHPPASDPAQLQLLRDLMRLVLHGILLAGALAAGLLLCLCLGQLQRPRRERPALAGRGKET